MIRVFQGRVRPLPPDNRPTGIFKQEITSPVWVSRVGLYGDSQADRRVHGGPEKALHQYPVAHYATLVAMFPDAREALVPGSIGENISMPGWDESNVAIGDIFQFGQARIQVSQPRTPCWKIDHRFSAEGMAQRIAEMQITGWYFRVLEAGEVAPDAVFERISQSPDPVTIANLLTVWAEHRPDPVRLEHFTCTPGLSQNWVAKLNNRAARLRTMTG